MFAVALPSDPDPPSSSSTSTSSLVCEGPPPPPRMPATDSSSSVPFVSLGRSFLSLRRDNLQSPSDDGMPNPSTTASSSGSSHQELELEAFQKRVADLLNDLAGSDGGEILCIQWIRKLLDSFLLCQEEFRQLVLLNRKGGCAPIPWRPPLDRLLNEFFERAVKALDVCNAVRDGVDQIRRWESHLEIVLVALGDGPRTLGEGQFRRAKKALAEFAISMLDDKEAASVLSHRNRSFGRNSNSGKDGHRRSSSGPGHSRSLSWSVSRSWSAAKQLLAISNNLSAPRSNEVAATNGLAVPVYTMNTLLLFVMWALVAAIPCQDRGIQIHFSVPRSFVWAAPVLSLHERIVEESKKKDRKNCNGLLKEIHQIDRCVRSLTELTDVVQFPIEKGQKEAEIRERVRELAQVCGAVKDGLDPLERQVKEVFRRIVRSRTEALDSMAQAPHT